jgi:hypothetical protein
MIKKSWARTKISGPPGAKILLPSWPRKKFCLDAVRVPSTRTALLLTERSVMLSFTRSLQRLWRYSWQAEFSHCIFYPAKIFRLLSKANYQLIIAMNFIRPWNDRWRGDNMYCARFIGCNTCKWRMKMFASCAGVVKCNVNLLCCSR